LALYEETLREGGGDRGKKGRQGRKAFPNLLFTRKGRDEKGGWTALRGKKRREVIAKPFSSEIRGKDRSFSEGRGGKNLR